MKFLPVLSLFLLALLPVDCHGGMTRNMAAEHDAHEAEQRDRRNIPGGYSLIEDVTDERVVTEANFVLSELLQFAIPPRSYSFQKALSEYSANEVNVKIAKAMEQVVQGLNVRMILMLTDASTQECLGAFAVSIYDKFGDLSITKWNKETTCAHAKDSMND
eukprot:CAMPEP_0198148288 /NCGR_PEP_ID=MMETSP1443-20131203/40860_1 /TAXON_ID=186043 /ORGANISM="Entomoneis sp., Strain CCMP2396" /LENGTH=160 /DNA_ID=CAMNT_0043812943 /DNA_START=56 /DNA_END=538 /DNA_ORIENTATION=+